MKSIILSTINISSENAYNLIEQCLIKTPYTDDKGFGFENLEVEDDFIAAVLIKRNTTSIYEYNPIIKSMIKKQIMLYTEIPFEIDTRYNVLSVFGPAPYLTQLKTAFKHSFDFDYELGQSNISPYQIYLDLLKKGIFVKFQSMSIENFVFKNGISGRLIGNVTDDTIAEELVKLYKTDVSKVLFEISINENEHFVVQIANNGLIKFHDAVEKFYDHFDFFKKTLFT